jgi:transcriptional regulator with XRE-family HTH domain
MGMNFSNWLAKHMANENINQAQLARKSGLTRQAISYYLSGKSKQPDEFALQKIARAFSIPVEQLYREVGILPSASHVNEQIEEIEELAKGLSKEDQHTVIEFIKMLDRLRAKKKK